MSLARVVTVSLGSMALVSLALSNIGTAGVAYYNYQSSLTNYRTAENWRGKAETLQRSNREISEELRQTKQSLDDTQKSLSSMRTNLSRTKSELGQRQQQLQTTTRQLGQTQAESQRRLGIIFSQQENLKILKACLAGVAVSQEFYKEGVAHHLAWLDSPNDYDFLEALRNYKRAADIMKSVGVACDRAYALFE